MPPTTLMDDVVEELKQRSELAAVGSWRVEHRLDEVRAQLQFRLDQLACEMDLSW